MTEKPIIFNDAMVRAILDGRKTQTRRVAKLNDAGRVSRGGKQWHVDDPDAARACPYGEPGDLLWVRETWAPSWTYGGDYPCVLYKATGDGYIGSEQYPARGVISSKFGIHSGEADASASNTVRWRPSVHMPRWASRITLEITDVRVERLQEISPNECIAEGAWKIEDRALGRSGEALDAFRNLWDALNAKRGHSWETNPWVWVIEFKRVEAMG